VQLPKRLSSGLIMRAPTGEQEATGQQAADETPPISLCRSLRPYPHHQTPEEDSLPQFRQFMMGTNNRKTSQTNEMELDTNRRRTNS